MSWLLFLFLLITYMIGEKSIERHDVYIAGFFPYSKYAERSATGRGVMPSVKLALDHVNDHYNILRNYRLHMWWNDTMCNTAVGVKAFFDMMHNGPCKVMLFGAACTHVTDPIAKVSKHWYITQLSYADTHPMFTKASFPNFFRIVPSDTAFNAPRLALLNEFNWTRVGTIYQNEPRYSLAHNRLLAELDLLGYQVVESQSFTNEIHTALVKLKEKDTRIILGNFNEYWALHVFCEAYQLEMYGRRYQWIIMATYSSNWWSKSVDGVNCTEDEIIQSLQQTIVTDILPLSTSDEITISGITPAEYEDEYNSRRGSDYSRYHGYAYDGIWAIALAIEHVSNRVGNFRPNQTVVDFQYRDPLWEQLFLEALANTSFEGVTGPVRFYRNERKANIMIRQFQDDRDVKIGEFNSAKNHLDLSLGEQLFWLGKNPPKDRTLVMIEHQKLNRTVLVAYTICSVLGIIMAVFFLCINIKYRNQRYIKMSSPQLNNLIIIGCMLTYSSVILLGLDSVLTSVDAFPYVCTARAWTLMAGFSLAFGAMFSKTWRVHSIFTDVKLNKKVIKDYQLFIVVGVLLVIDLAIMLTWQISDPFYRETKQLEAYPHPRSEDIVIIPENEYCSSEKMSLFIGSIYVYKGLLMIFGAFLAWETRNVSIPALNDSRHVGLSVYNVAIMCICGAAVAFVSTDHQDAMFLIIGIFILFCTTATLWLVFIPKLLELKRNPAGAVDRKVRATLKPMSTIRSSSGAASVSSFYESKLREIKINNSHYRKLLTEKETELQNLLEYFDNDDEILHMLDTQFRTTTGSGSNCNNQMSRNQIPVPPIVHLDVPSNNTLTSDNTSSCSLNSSTPYNSSERNTTAMTSSRFTPKHSNNLQTPLLNLEKIDNKRPSLGQVRQHLVTKNELWDTNTFAQPSQTVASPQQQQQQQQPLLVQTHKCSHTKPRHVQTKTTSHFQSTPNMNAATRNSEPDLLMNSEEIIPIFQKLLNQRQKDISPLGRSCPNISIKCDIVEYL